MSQAISNLPVGAKVVDPSTTYYNAPITWIVLEHGHDDANGTTLLSEKILCLKAFDAKEPNNSNSGRKNYGNSRYAYSNILQWLNSDATAGSWYSAKHAADQSPDSTTYVTYNPYTSEAGFLHGFSDGFKDVLMEVDKVTSLNTATDGGGTEAVKSKIFLLSCTECGLSEDNGTAGTIYSYFSANNTNEQRKAYPTAEAVSNSTYASSSINESSAWYWWLRSPNASYSYYARFVGPVGERSSDFAYNGIYGVRPACLISFDTKVLDEPNADGAYEIDFSSYTIKDIFIGVNGVACRVINAYVGVDGVAQSIYSATPSWKPSYDANNNPVKYAVQLYGIKADTIMTDSGEATAGLTFGPALGLTPSQTGIGHTPTGISAGGNPMRCIHDDDWATIAYWSKTDPTVYADCIANGCTHAVRLNLNDTIKGDILTGFGESSDGSGVLYNNLADAYTRWNPTSNIDTTNISDSRGSNKFGWSGSKIRATLNGSDGHTKIAVASGIDAADQTILTSGNSLLSCFDPEVRSIIAPKVIVGDKDGYSTDGTTTYKNQGTTESLTTTYDKLWLFSTKEIGFGGASASDNNIKNYSGHNGSEYTSKLSAWGISDVSIGLTSGNAQRSGYNENGTASNVWLRSPYSGVAGYVWRVYTDGSGKYNFPYIPYALAPGFCLP